MTTSHIDRKTALDEIAQRLSESRRKLITAMRDLLDSRKSMLAAVEARATLLADIDAAAAAEPDNIALVSLASEKSIILGELNAQKKMLDSGESALRTDPAWTALLDSLEV